MNYAKRLLPVALFLFALYTATPTFADGSGLPPVDDGGGGVLAAAVFSGAAAVIAFLRGRRWKK